MQNITILKPHQKGEEKNILADNYLNSRTPAKDQFYNEDFSHHLDLLINTAISEKRNPIITTSVIIQILEAAIQAPSGDNNQPWKFKLNDNQISIYINKPDNSNINEIASLISCGAVIENIQIAASKHCLSVSINSSLTQKDNLQEIASITLNKNITNKLCNNLYLFIKERHTNRTKFNKKPIPSSDLQKLQQAIIDIKDVNLHLITDEKQKNKIAKLVYGADLIRAEKKELHEYLMKMIRFTDEEALRTRDGFHVKNLEAGRDGEQLLKLIKPWQRMKWLNKIGMSKLFANVSKSGVKQSSAMGFITVKGTTINDFINAGKAMQRIWLTATSLGIDFQPMGAVTLFWMNFKFGQQDTFSKEHQSQLQQLWEDYKQNFCKNEEELPAMLFRIGYGKQVKVKTLRKNLAEFLA